MSCFSIYSHLNTVDLNLKTTGCCNQKRHSCAHSTMLILNLVILNIFSMHFVVLMCVCVHLIIINRSFFTDQDNPTISRLMSVLNNKFP